jgi:hypothetical protein
MLFVPIATSQAYSNRNWWTPGRDHYAKIHMDLSRTLHVLGDGSEGPGDAAEGHAGDQFGDKYRQG